MAAAHLGENPAACQIPIGCLLLAVWSVVWWTVAHLMVVHSYLMDGIMVLCELSPKSLGLVYLLATVKSLPFLYASVAAAMHVFSLTLVAW